MVAVVMVVGEGVIRRAGLRGPRYAHTHGTTARHAVGRWRQRGSDECDGTWMAVEQWMRRADGAALRMGGYLSLCEHGYSAERSVSSEPKRGGSGWMVSFEVERRSEGKHEMSMCGEQPGAVWCPSDRQHRAGAGKCG